MWFRKLLKVFLPLAFIAAGLLVAGHLYATKPKARRVRPERPTPLVEVIKANASDHLVRIEAMGTVSPAKKITLKPRVAGRVVEMAEAFSPGGILWSDDPVLKLDTTDFELEVKKQKSQVSKAAADWQLEKGKQDVARNELKLMQSISGKKVKSTALALRQPQRAQAAAELQSARLALEQAELNLERTRVKVPFNCMVLERNVDLGSQVTTQESLATLVGTDAYWVEVSVPVDRLGWIDIPVGVGEGSPARVIMPSGEEREGTVIRLMGEISTDSRMARVVVRVDDPLNLKVGAKGAPLLLGSYVTVVIEGKLLENVYKLPRSALRDDDTIWLFRDGSLSIKKVKTAWRGMQNVYVTEGMEPGDRIISSELTTPVEGMAVRLEGQAPAQGQPGQGMGKPGQGPEVGNAGRETGKARPGIVGSAGPAAGRAGKDSE